MGIRKERPIVFVSTLRDAPWGGSEQLWGEAAMCLRAEGLPISACVLRWSPPDPHILAMREAGIDVLERPQQYSIWKQATHKAARHSAELWVRELDFWLRERSPSLVVINDGFAFPPLDLLESCVGNKRPFVTLSHANYAAWWPNDDKARRYHAALEHALRCYFVSQENLNLAEKQIGFPLSKTAIVRNPYGIPFNCVLPWPDSSPLQLACVGRLDPAAKGQDLLFEALSDGEWKHREWHLNLYGVGRFRFGLERIAERLALSDRVTFKGFSSVEDIWSSNHVLVLPSRYEGLPITIVEAMLCGRPVVTTDVAGNAEFVLDGVTGFVAEAPVASSIGKALDRLWERRDSLAQIGASAATRIREVIPENPSELFAEELKRVAGLSN
jgi:glycosyltransferase involved in cell wall biosynthesis